MLLLGGVLSLILAVVPIHTGTDTRLAVQPDVAVQLPPSGAFRAVTLVLFGRSARDPSGRDLRCEVTTADGRETGGITDHRQRCQRLAVDRTFTDPEGRQGEHLSDFTEGWLFTCTGPLARTAQPLYLLGDRTRLIPPGVIAPFGLLCLALGFGALMLAGRDAADS